MTARVALAALAALLLGGIAALGGEGTSHAPASSYQRSRRTPAPRSAGASGGRLEVTT